MSQAHNVDFASFARGPAQPLPGEFVLNLGCPACGKFPKAWALIGSAESGVRVWGAAMQVVQMAGGCGTSRPRTPGAYVSPASDAGDKANPYDSGAAMHDRPVWYCRPSCKDSNGKRRSYPRSRAKVEARFIRAARAGVTKLLFDEDL